jgi:urea transport system substrate-binding protein
VFGCWTSASRKAVLPVFEKDNGLLYYPTFYEGLEQSKNVFYTGQEATQQIVWALDWASNTKKAKTFFLIGSDYIWPRTSNKIARKPHRTASACEGGGRGVLPARHDRVRVADEQDQAGAPGLHLRDRGGRLERGLLQAAQGGGHHAAEAVLLTLSVTEDEVLGIGGENFAGFYSSMKYFQSLDNNNKKFVAAFKARYGQKSVIGDVTQAAYLGPWIWKAACERGQFRRGQGGRIRPASKWRTRRKATRRSMRTTTCGAAR